MSDEECNRVLGSMVSLNENHPFSSLPGDPFGPKTQHAFIPVKQLCDAPPPPMNDIGNPTMQEYAMGSEIGKGAYAVVRTAYHRPTKLRVAVKIYDKASAQFTVIAKSIEKEIKILRKLDHPNIMKLYETIETEEHLYLISEHVLGSSLLSYVRRRSSKGLDENDAKPIFRAILQAVSYCHARNISHRDIKLENILIDTKGNVKLIDFGFSTCVPSEKKCKLFCGTPSYMSPEIVRKTEYLGAPVDIWACGVMLYVMLTGAFPFKGSEDDGLYEHILHGKFSFPVYTSEAAQLLITQMLMAAPELRPKAQELLQSQWFPTMPTPSAGHSVSRSLELTCEFKRIRQMDGQYVLERIPYNW